MTNEPLSTARSGGDRLLQLEVRARKILDTIERRCLQIRSATHGARQLYFDSSPSEDVSSEDFYSRAEEPPLTLSDLNRYARQWKILLPSDLETRAAFVHVFAQKYALNPNNHRKLQAALELESSGLQQAFVDLYDKPFEAIFGQVVDTIPAVNTDPVEAETTAFNEVAAEWDLLGDDLEWVSLPSGAMLYRQGDPGDALFILVSGRLRLTISDAAGERVVAEIGRGEMVGEIGALTGEAHKTSVIALRDSQLIRISQDDLERLGGERPQLMMRLVRLMAERLRDRLVPSRKSGNSLVTIAVLRAGRPIAKDGPAFSGTTLEDMIFRLAETIGAYGPTLLLNSEQLDRQVGQAAAQAEEDGDGAGWLAAYLSEQETHYRYVIYEADAAASNWTRRCLRQADHVLLIAESGDEFWPGPAETLLDTMPGRPDVELVLIHPDTTRRPEGTLRWLEPRRLAAHHHVRRHNAGDLKRLARRLTGRALGLVLSGGGARGFAHLGVLRAMREAGLEADLVGGASMGSIIAAIHAMDMDESEAIALARDVASPFKLFDLTLPLVSFFKSDKMTKVLHRLFEDVQIEDLWRPYFCVSSSLTRARVQVHTQGPVWEAVRASSAIPGVFSPFLKDGELLVDGAVLNNMPVDIMQRFSNGGPIAAVNVFPEVDLLRDYDFGPSVSGWEVLFRRLNPLSDNVSAPLIFENILRVIALNDVHQAKLKSQWCDLYITPKVEDFGILEFQSYQKVIEIGYRSAVEAIEAWSRGAKTTGELAPEEAPASAPIEAAVENRQTKDDQTQPGFDRLLQSLDELDLTLSRL